jgi:hypothetical protein
MSPRALVLRGVGQSRRLAAFDPAVIGQSLPLGRVGLAIDRAKPQKTSGLDCEVSMFSCVLLLSFLASPAMAFQARNDAQVTGTAAEIVVASRPGLSSSESWCAAGDFVIRALGQPATTPLYRVTPPPRRAGETVTFSLSSEAATDRTGLLLLGDRDASLSAGHAQALCRLGRWRF